MDFAELPLWLVFACFAAAAVIIAAAGTRLTRMADRLADMTGMGEALLGAVILGGVTSLSGVMTSVSAAWYGAPVLSVSNAIGGIAAQTAFLGVADLAYRKANLEHASASVENMMWGALLIALLALVLMATAVPQVEIFGVHPASPAIVALYLFGLRQIRQARALPLWVPRSTPLTKPDVPDEEHKSMPMKRTSAEFAALAILIAVSGWVVARTGIVIADQTGISESIAGALLTAVATSSPELVTSVAAVRRGALTLAVGGILGGNAFDVLFVPISDVAFRAGPIYASISLEQVMLIGLSLLLTSILLMGQLRRERKGFLGIGFESAAVLFLYLMTMVLLATIAEV